MARVTKVQVAWAGLVDLLVHDDCRLPSPCPASSAPSGAASNESSAQPPPQPPSEAIARASSASFASASARLSQSSSSGTSGSGSTSMMMIRYEDFLASFAVQYGKQAAKGRAGHRVFDALYANRKQVGGRRGVCVCGCGWVWVYECQPQAGREVCVRPFTSSRHAHTHTVIGGWGRGYLLS